MTLLDTYRALVDDGVIEADPAQASAAHRLNRREVIGPHRIPHVPFLRHDILCGGGYIARAGEDHGLEQ